jgi:integrase/recombinase XerD
MRAAAAEPDPLRRLVVELLARTGLRVSELCDLAVDAVTLIGEGHWLKVPLGKLGNDRYIPLHPQLVELIVDYLARRGSDTSGRLLSKASRPLDRHMVTRILDRMATAAGIGHVHPHQLRHTLATQAINRGMSLEAIAALLGHRWMRMTLVYARIADARCGRRILRGHRESRGALRPTQDAAADAEGAKMRRLRAEANRRMLGNGYCARPVELDCTFESICETCTYFQTTIEFRPTLQRQRDDAAAKGQTGRQQLFDGLLEQFDDQAS